MNEEQAERLIDALEEIQHSLGVIADMADLVVQGDQHHKSVIEVLRELGATVEEGVDRR